jgi:EAL domain-containing protein (putative c-di-GMP-specific phosphodiesterase class I)
MPMSVDLERTYHTRDLMEALLADPRQLGPDYEPIHSLADGTLLGYKATGRGAAGTELSDTLSLLDGARSLGFVERIDWAFRALAFEDMLERPGIPLHLTPEPETYATPCAPRFARIMGRANRELKVAAEVHHDAFATGVALDAGLREIRDWGWQLVLADLADDDDAVRRAATLAPDIVQIDLRLPGRTQPSEHHGVRRLLAIGAEAGAQIMALGVDSPRLRDVALELGASSARGRVFGQPGPLPTA